MAGSQMPQVTVEIRGADRTGKSVVAQVLRQALRRERVTVICPDREARRRAEELRQALVDLQRRGLLVEVVESETAGPIRPKVPIDARSGARPLVEGLRGWAAPTAFGAKRPPGLPADDRAALLRLGFEPISGAATP